MYPAEPIPGSNASNIMLFILSFRYSNGDGPSQWLSPFSFAGLQTMRRAKLICESPSTAKRSPDDLATILKRVSPFKELANKAATFRQARYRALEELKTARRVETDKRLGKSCYVRRTLAPAEKPGSEVVTKARHKSKFQTGEVCDKKPRHESWICL